MHIQIMPPKTACSVSGFYVYKWKTKMKPRNIQQFRTQSDHIAQSNVKPRKVPVPCDFVRRALADFCVACAVVLVVVCVVPPPAPLSVVESCMCASREPHGS